MIQFIEGHSYVAEFIAGTSFIVTVEKRTAKTITVRTNAWGSQRTTIKCAGPNEYIKINSAFCDASDDLATERGQDTNDSHSDDYLYF